VSVFIALPLILQIGRPDAAEFQADRFLGAMSIFWTVAGLMLAGSGVRTQSTNFQSVRGGHRSIYFTLSLPVTRLRWLAVRTAAGMFAVCAVVLITCVCLFLFLPALRVPPVMALEYFLVILVCQSAFYSLSMFFSTFLDEVYQGWAGMAIVMSGGFYSMRASLPPLIDLFRAMGPESPIVTHTIPWAALAGSIVISVLLFLASLKIVRTREY
jgi:hypothetical protein